MEPSAGGPKHEDTDASDAEGAMAYKQDILEAITAALDHVLEHRPARPLADISDFLASWAEERGGAPSAEPQRAVPTSLTDALTARAHASQTRANLLLVPGKASDDKRVHQLRRQHTFNDIFKFDFFHEIDTEEMDTITVGQLRSHLVHRFPPSEVEALLSALVPGAGPYGDEVIITREIWLRRLRLAPFIPERSNHDMGELIAQMETVRALAPSTRVDAMRTEERGISLGQLRAFYRHIEVSCEREGWTDIHGQPLMPERTTLYDAVKYGIKPATEGRQSSYVEHIATDAAAQRPRWFVSHWWGHPVVNTLRCIEQHAADHEYDESATCASTARAAPPDATAPRRPTPPLLSRHLTT